MDRRQQKTRKAIFEAGRAAREEFQRLPDDTPVPFEQIAM